MLWFLSAWLLLLDISGGYTKTFAPYKSMFLEDSSRNDQVHGFYSVSDREENIYSQIQLLNKLHNNRQEKHSIDAEMYVPAKNNVEESFLVVKTMRHRDKRYISYLTLCHFKICNMGRKRTTRYFQVIRTLNDNDS